MLTSNVHSTSEELSYLLPASWRHGMPRDVT